VNLLIGLELWVTALGFFSAFALLIRWLEQHLACKKSPEVFFEIGGRSVSGTTEVYLEMAVKTEVVFSVMFEYWKFFIGSKRQWCVYAMCICEWVQFVRLDFCACLVLVSVSVRSSSIVFIPSCSVARMPSADGMSPTSVPQLNQLTAVYLAHLT